MVIPKCHNVNRFASNLALSSLGLGAFEMSTALSAMSSCESLVKIGITCGFFSGCLKQRVARLEKPTRHWADFFTGWSQMAAETFSGL